MTPENFPKQKENETQETVNYKPPNFQKNKRDRFSSICPNCFNCKKTQKELRVKSKKA